MSRHQNGAFLVVRCRWVRRDDPLISALREREGPAVLTVIGLSLNTAGAILVGFLFPKHSIPTVGDVAAAPEPVDWVGRLALKGGWAMVVAGFVLQLVGQLSG